MRKIFKGSYLENGKRNRIECTVTDENGYINITADVIPWRCRTPQMCGCLHEEISKAFPKLRKVIPMHLSDVSTGLASWAVENAMHHIANGEYNNAQRNLRATDAEMRELIALCNYGLCKTKWCNSFYHFTSPDAKSIFLRECFELGIIQRAEEDIKNFYAYMEVI